MPMQSLTTKPGTFRARCNLRRQVPWDKMTAELWEIALARGYTRVFRELASGRRDPETGKKGRWEVSFAGCEGFETDDRAAYTAHMADLHNGGLKLTQPVMHRGGRGMWRGPRLLEDGRPWPDDTRTETCGACGLVAEVDDTAAAALWWREHLERCTGQAVA